MPRKDEKKHTAKQVIAAIVDSAGVKTTIGKRLGVHRHTIDRYLIEYPTATLAYKNEVETIGDFVEAVILEAIKAKDVETAKWYAKSKLKNRGYTDRTEVTGSDGQPIRFIVEVPPRTETPEQWMQEYTKSLTLENGHALENEHE